MRPLAAHRRRSYAISVINQFNRINNGIIALGQVNMNPVISLV